MSLERRRVRELWGAALGPAGLLGALWGVIIGSDGLLLAALLAMAIEAFVIAYGWRAALTQLAIGTALLAFGTEFPVVSGVSELASAAVPLLAVNSVLHALAYFGTGHRLMEKLVESGEFEREHEVVARFQGRGASRWW